MLMQLFFKLEELRMQHLHTWQKKKKQSEANLYIVPFCRYNLNESMPLSMLKHMDEDVPPVFMILDTYDKDVKSLLPGAHLFCVYGDNWFQSVRYTLRCLVASGPSGETVDRIRDTENKLADKKQHLETFQTEFCDIKKKFEEACKKLEQDITETQELMDAREKAYVEYIAESAAKYSGSHKQGQHVANASSGGLFGGLGKLFG